MNLATLIGPRPLIMPAARRLVGPLALLGALALWQLLWLTGLPDFVLSPAEVATHFIEALRSGELLPHVAASLVRSLPGFALGTAAGIALGLGAGAARGFDQLLSPVVFLTYPVPKIVFLPIFMLWFGIGDLSKVLIIALACFYPSFINAYYGARATPTILVWSALNMGAGRGADLPEDRGPRRAAADLRRYPRVAGAVVHPALLHRDDQRALGARVPDPAVGE